MEKLWRECETYVESGNGVLIELGAETGQCMWNLTKDTVRGQLYLEGPSLRMGV